MRPGSPGYGHQVGCPVLDTSYSLYPGAFEAFNTRLGESDKYYCGWRHAQNDTQLEHFTLACSPLNDRKANRIKTPCEKATTTHKRMGNLDEIVEKELGFYISLYLLFLGEDPRFLQAKNIN